MTTEDYICYEFPLNERIRVFMRLEQLFLQLDHFLNVTSIWDKREAVNSLVEILQVFSRHDLKADTLKELERHTKKFKQLASNKGVDTNRLDEIQNDLSAASKALYASNGKIDLASMKSDLFETITQRSNIPGGLSSFDLPAYHYWLEQSEQRQNDDIHNWLQHFTPIRTAVDLILQFIRLSGVNRPTIAPKGFYQATLDRSLPYQIVIVKTVKTAPYFAEISGGKHRFTTRFMSPANGTTRPRQTDQDVDFLLRYCIF